MNINEWMLGDDIIVVFVIVIESVIFSLSTVVRESWMSRAPPLSFDLSSFESWWL